ncbi:MAG: prepilin-type N-terminal cleavage/methylation domain-containing protein [Fusobacteriales bacterium]|jgi:type IV pilus assembly protein PilA|nr:prepilin-type N-terminal cleavage/methylation domain-containing protein [Fusobacteriales bacterium]
MKKGFTLVEVILVLAIIAIIATIAIPQVNKYLDKANKSKILGAISDLNNSSLSWSIENNGSIPDDIQKVFQEHGDIEKLNINLKTDASFELGNIKGKFFLDDGEISAKIDSDSRSFKGETLVAK